MSDPLDRAVDARIDAYRPDALPPFEAIEARKRGRDRRRTATGAAALSVVAVAGIVFVPSLLSGGQDRLPSFANPNPNSTQAAAQELADRLCADAARQYDGEVAAAYAITVQDVRDYFPDSNGVGGDPSAGPDSRVVVYPTGWDQTSLSDPAAACYIDASFPAPAVPGAVNPERALIMTAEGATAFIATAGSKENLPPAPLTEPTRQEPELPSGSDGTRYSVTYDSEAVYNERGEAVQACLDLPGTSQISSQDSLPPIVGVTVTGLAEDAAFRNCMSSLDGLTLAAEIPYEPDTAPDTFVNRSTLPSCGTHATGIGPVPRVAIECFAGAVGSEAGAEYALTRLTEEGDPYVVYYRALPGQQVVEVFIDSTRDKFGSQQWRQASCTGYDPAFGQATGCPPNGTGQI